MHFDYISMYEANAQEKTEFTQLLSLHIQKCSPSLLKTCFHLVFLSG